MVSFSRVFELNNKFGVLGVWPEGADGTDVNSAARSHNNQLLVTGDDFGKVHLYKYPVTQPQV